MEQERLGVRVHRQRERVIAAVFDALRSIPAPAMASASGSGDPISPMRNTYHIATHE